MGVTIPRYSKEEFARRGQEIYERAIRPRIESGNEGKFVAIDIETGAYEMDADDYTATERLLARTPEAQIWLLRVGHPTAYRIGLRPLREGA
ncbi:MAG: hypothetical protein HY268_34475 [Deltaproteobacteria bacterium]|nr:hypothetical protein [Deltaproteobacteria bacterium]